MTNEEFIKLYDKRANDESLTPFQNEVGFSLIRNYPEGSDYKKDGRKMFIKLAIIDDCLFYSVNRTRPEGTGSSTNYILVDGNEYKKKVTNFISDRSDSLGFDNATKKIKEKSTGRSFTVDEFIEYLVSNHLSDRLRLKRMGNWVVNKLLELLFWLSDSHYDRIETAIDKYHYTKGERPKLEEKENIEPFFKYFFISKNILFTFLIFAFPSSIFWGRLWRAGDFTLSNPSIVLLFFLILSLCEKFSIWLDKKIKEFLIPQDGVFSDKNVNFIERLHNYQYRDNFKLKLSIK